MAKNSKQHKTGRKGETTILKFFEDLGYVCNKISEDYGEDFFVYGEDKDSTIEPFKIFIQAKASEVFDKTPSDWTEYIDPLTVRNWILSNELTIIVRTNLISGETKYCTPADEIEYWEIDTDKKVPIKITNDFDGTTVEKLIWQARIRHYDHLMRITMPNNFENQNFRDTPRFKLFLLEFLIRLGVIKNHQDLSKKFRDAYAMKRLELEKTPEEYPASPDMTSDEKIRYAACLLALLNHITETTGYRIGLMPLFLDSLACLVVQFIIPTESTTST